MTNKLRLPILYSIVLSVFLISGILSCNFKVNETKVSQGLEIDWETRKEIRSIGQNIFNDLKQQKTDYLKTVLNDSLKLKSSIVDSLFQSVKFTTDGQINIYGEFLVQNSSDLAINNINSAIGKHEYWYFFRPSKTEGYVYLFSVPDISEKHQILVSMYLEKNKEKWEIAHFHVGYFMYEHYTGPDLAYAAMDIFDRGYLLPAVIQMQFATQLMLPANDNFHFREEETINTYATQVIEDVYRNYRFPLMVASIPTLPKIFQITSRIYYGKLSPLIVYKSNIALHDTKSLETENDQLNKRIEDIFPGIKYIGDSILYQVVNEIPDSNHNVKYSGFVKKQY